MRGWNEVVSPGRLVAVVALVSACVGPGSGCAAHPALDVDPRFIDEPADASCEVLWKRTLADGWRASVDHRSAGSSSVLASDETWVLLPDARIVYGMDRTLRRVRADQFSVRVHCGQEFERRSVPTRTCTVGPRRFAVVDPDDVVAAAPHCARSDPLWIEVVGQLPDGSTARHYETAVRRPSLRPWIEVRR